MNALNEIKSDEGRRPCVYRDSRGLWTIGDGILVDPSVPGAGLRPEEMDFITTNRIALAEADLARRLPWVAALDEVRRAALVDMAYQLGAPGLLGFRSALTFCALGQWDKAADAFLASLWAKQTPERAQRLAKQIKTGTWPT